MKNAHSFVVVLVTAPNLKTARSLAQSTLRARLAACANLVPKIESHYWWQGRLEKGAEVLILFKTQQSRLAALEKHLLAAHPYETPEIIALPITSGTRRYLDWLGKEVGNRT